MPEVNKYSKPISHYYGDIVRMLFLLSAVIMLVGLPVMADYINLPVMASVIGILILGLAAGLTNPKQIWDAWINAAIAGTGFVVFESFTVNIYKYYGPSNRFFIVNMVLGFVFMFAVYFSVKTLRGLMLAEKDQTVKAEIINK